jgi:hypothetical protein
MGLFRTSASWRALVAFTGLLAACANPPDGEENLPDFEGRLETIVVEGPQGATRHFLLLDDGSDPVELQFDSDPTWGSGARIGVRGRFEGTRFRVTAFDRVALPDEADTVREGALNGVTPERTRTVAFVMVDYGMGVNRTRDAAQTFMFSTTNPGPTLGIGAGDKSVLQFYDETSYGLFNISGGVEGPLSWTGGAACNGSGGSQLAQMLRPMLSMTYGHNIWYYGSRQSACEYGWGSLGNWTTPSSNVWFNGALFDGAITHEIGHNLGYQHASSIRCSGTPLANDPLTCTTTEYGSEISIMGNLANGHMMGLEKWYAGWFKGCNGVRVRSSGTFNLLPIESRCVGGVQTLQIPMPVTNRQFDPAQTSTAPIRYYYLEYRNGTGLDTGMTPAVHVVASDDIAAPNRVCARSVHLDMVPSNSRQNGMTAGQSFTDPAGGVTFSVTSIAAGGAVVSVTLDGAGSPNTCMDGAPLTGSGPTTCGGGTGTGGGGSSGGAGGATGTGGAGGRGGTTGAAGAGGRGGATGTGGAAGRGGTIGTGGAGGRGGASGSGAAGTAGGAGGGSGAGGAASGGGGTGGSTSGRGGGSAAGTGGSAMTGTGGGRGGSNTGAAGTSGSAGSGNTGVAGSAGPGTGGGAAPGEASGGCACELGGSAGGGATGLAFAFALSGVVLARRRRSSVR